MPFNDLRFGGHPANEPQGNWRIGGNTTSVLPGGFESLVRPFQVVQTNLPAAEKAPVPLPGEGTAAFISWGSGSNFQGPNAPNEDTTQDKSCSYQSGYTTTLWPDLTSSLPTALSDVPALSGPATSGTRLEADPATKEPGQQTLLDYWTANGWTITGTGDFYVQVPAAKTVTWYATEIAALQAREDANQARKDAGAGSGSDGKGSASGGSGGSGSGSTGNTKPSDPRSAAQPTRSTNKSPAKNPAQQKYQQKQKLQDKKPGISTLEEIDRQVETITVYKPGDKNTFVNVQRILSIRFRGPGGQIYKFNMKPPKPPPRPET